MQRAGGELPLIAATWLWMTDRANDKVLASQSEVVSNIRRLLLQTQPHILTATLWLGSHDAQPQLQDPLASRLAVGRVPDSFGGVRMNGYIAKAWALMESHTAQNGFTILFDGDVYPCDRWVDYLASQALQGSVDVVWSLEAEGVRCSGYANRSCTLAVSPSIAQNATNLAEFAAFGERNSGTIFAVRRSDATLAWMRDAVRIYGELVSSKFVAGNNHLADQPAWRESFFLHRHVLRERLLPRSRACHKMAIAPPGNCSCWCGCSACTFVHGHNSAKQCLGTLAAQRIAKWAGH